MSIACTCVNASSVSRVTRLAGHSPFQVNKPLVTRAPRWKYNSANFACEKELAHMHMISALEHILPFLNIEYLAS